MAANEISLFGTEVDELKGILETLKTKKEDFLEAILELKTEKPLAVSKSGRGAIAVVESRDPRLRIPRYAEMMRKRKMEKEDFFSSSLIRDMKLKRSCKEMGPAEDAADPLQNIGRPKEDDFFSSLIRDMKLKRSCKEMGPAEDAADPLQNIGRPKEDFFTRKIQRKQ